MTDPEKELFLSVMASGCFMGMGHPFECLLNYERMLDAVASSETELSELMEGAQAAFKAFWQTTDPDLANLTDDQFNEIVNAWFENREKQKKRWLENEIEQRQKEPRNESHPTGGS